jgi:tetratricopeptide (TPR) repeat protein
MIILKVKDRKWLRLKPTLLIFSLVSVCFIARTIQRSWDWETGLSLYMAEIKTHPDDALMNNNVGVELFRLGRFDEAKLFLEKSVAINPLWATSLSNLGAVEQHFEQNDKALQHYERSMEVGDYQLAYENYAKLLFGLGQRDKCLAFLRDRALPRYPNDPLLQQINQELLKH